ncbi:hypothetical protein N752_05055 [Desulforamulus aquiferis]|nr:hypothetical protein [Desulforamulus aquiferis]RYD06262.1 hypothetical protein N752_05055 [Desulforamulus aquiferis]
MIPASLYIIDALNFEQQKPEPKVATIITQIYDRITAGETKLTLMEYYPDEHPINVVRAAGVPGEEKTLQVPLFELDRIEWIDHLTSLYIEPLKVDEEARKIIALKHMPVRGWMLHTNALFP